ncbi:MAG: hypothetical protein U5L45_22555 [Saprospiraceae bacterium]|nr:hypothetical protein [Saprospiraceae bacterium]
MLNKKNLLISLGTLFLITGCGNVKNLEITPENNIINKESSLQIRDIQVKTFENTSRANLINAIVDTLLDDGYFITTIDTKAGVVSAKNIKNDVELNLVSVVKEVKNESFSVRFSINAVDRSSDFKSITVIQDDIIYRYLFDKLRKSLFLDQEFYKVPQQKEPQTVIQKEVTIIEKIVEPKVGVKTESKKVIKKCSTSKCQENSSLIYSVQFLCTTNKGVVQKEFEKLKNEDLDVRVHPYYEYQVLRLGRFKTRIEAEDAMQKFKSNYPEISIVAFKPKR